MYYTITGEPTFGSPVTLKVDVIEPVLCIEHVYPTSFNRLYDQDFCHKEICGKAKKVESINSHTLPD